MVDIMMTMQGRNMAEANVADEEEKKRREEELEDLKLLLRATLVASDGLLQSRVGKEFFDLTRGDRLDFTRHGFATLYDFLVSLEGEVTRLEFSPKDGENLVYAVLDKTKFASAHAKKYASRSRTSLKHRSPSEVAFQQEEQDFL